MKMMETRTNFTGMNIPYPGWSVSPTAIVDIATGKTLATGEMAERYCSLGHLINIVIPSYLYKNILLYRCPECGMSFDKPGLCPVCDPSAEYGARAKKIEHYRIQLEKKIRTLRDKILSS